MAIVWREYDVGGRVAAGWGPFRHDLECFWTLLLKGTGLLYDSDSRGYAGEKPLAYEGPIDRQRLLFFGLWLLVALAVVLEADCGFDRLFVR